MSVNASLPVLFAQLPHLSNVASTEQHHPEAQQQIAREHIVDELKRQSEKVPRLEQHEDAHKVKVDLNSGGGGGGGAGERQRKGGTDENEELPEGDPGRSPWSGNLVNTKV